MTKDETIAEMAAAVDNPALCYYGSDRRLEYIPVQQARRWLASLTAPPVEENLPTSESFGQVCNRVARDLPPGWNLNIELEADSGGVGLLDSTGEQVDFESNYESLLDQVNDAVAHAIECEQTARGEFEREASPPPAPAEPAGREDETGNHDANWLESRKELCRRAAEAIYERTHDADGEAFASAKEAATMLEVYLPLDVPLRRAPHELPVTLTPLAVGAVQRKETDHAREANKPEHLAYKYSDFVFRACEEANAKIHDDLLRHRNVDYWFGSITLQGIMGKHFASAITAAIAEQSAEIAKLEESLENMEASRSQALEENAKNVELDAEIARLTPLYLAVGVCAPHEVPAAVFNAWKEPAKYREDEIHRLREEVTSKEHEANCLRRERDIARKAINDFGKNPNGFDWAFLAKMDELETELTALKAKGNK